MSKFSEICHLYQISFLQKQIWRHNFVRLKVLENCPFTKRSMPQSFELGSKSTSSAWQLFAMQHLCSSTQLDAFCCVSLQTHVLSRMGCSWPTLFQWSWPPWSETNPLRIPGQTCQTWCSTWPSFVARWWWSAKTHWFCSSLLRLQGNLPGPP